MRKVDEKLEEMIITVLGTGFLLRLLCGRALEERNRSVPAFTAGGGDSPLLLLTHYYKGLSL